MENLQVIDYIFIYSINRWIYHLPVNFVYFYDSKNSETGKVMYNIIESSPRITNNKIKTDTWKIGKRDIVDNLLSKGNLECNFYFY